MPQPGQFLDCFELEEVIGIGGMGAVFRARDTKLDREVAVKLIPQDQSDDPEVVQRFYQEGRSAARLDHENIARVYTIGCDGPYHFIVFEYIAGETLRRRVDTSGPLKVGEAINYTLQIAAALVHASERGVVHRDIKPSNIIITPRGRAKLVDMGLARQFEREEDRGLTQSGMTLGTFDYISPEQARDPRDVDVRSDLYSLGCTLFHMLTGRPPFVGGTVLQKLLQHQEEAPPDVRDYNPDVGAELASVLTKLLAKDPDRRYQTPEQLVRDLLVLGASVDVELASPVGLLGSTLNDGLQPRWMGQLVWALPILAFFLVISGLVWWGRELNGPMPADSGSMAYKSIAANPAAGNRDSPPSDLEGSPAADDGEGANPTGYASTPSYPKNILVSSKENLLAKIETAPPRSTISLSDDGPYEIGGQDQRRSASQILKNRDLTIRAVTGTRPIVMPSTGLSQGEEPPAAMFDFIGGRITIEGIEFIVKGAGRIAPFSAIRTSDTELTLRRCTFRSPDEDGSREVTALRIHSTGATSTAGDRTASVHLDQSHFGGGQNAIAAEGPVDLVLRDCTLASPRAPLFIDNPRSSSGIPAQVRLAHASLMTGQGPIFRINGEARFWVDDCVIAPARRDTSTTLIEIDNPRNLIWSGRSNLYTNIATFLASTGGESGTEAITDFAKWSEPEFREVGSRVTHDGIWKLPNPLQAISRAAEHPSQSFLLAAASQGVDDSPKGIGARQGPLGQMIRESSPRSVPGDVKPKSLDGPRLIETQPSDIKSKAATRDDNKATQERAAQPPGNGEESAFLPPMPMRPLTVDDDIPLDEPIKEPAISETKPLPMPPMPVAVDSTHKSDVGGFPSNSDSGAAPERSVTNGTQPNRSNSQTSGEIAPAPTSTIPNGFQAKPTSSLVREIHTAEEFQGRLNELISKGGGVLRLAPDAEVELSSTILNGPGSWRIEGPGQSSPGHRPRIRFRPDQIGVSKSPSQWSILLILRSGRFQFQDIDIIVPEADDLQEDRIAAFGVGVKTELELTDCTITLVGDQTNSAAILALPETESHPEAREDLSARHARVVIRNSFLRSGGDILTLPTTPRGGIDAQLVNSVCVTEGSLLHARGGANRVSGGRETGPSGPTRLDLSLDRVTARTRQGLVRLESSHDEPELPVASVVARDSILCMTNPDDFLFRVDGHDQTVLALREHITWKGTRVAYHQITNYRRDQNRQTGSRPRIYDRQDWAGTTMDGDPIRDNLKFEKWDPDLPAWTLTQDDLRLNPDTARGQTGLGPDMKRIPKPPSVE